MSQSLCSGERACVTVTVLEVTHVERSGIDFKLPKNKFSLTTNQLVCGFFVFKKCFALCTVFLPCSGKSLRANGLKPDKTEAIEGKM